MFLTVLGTLFLFPTVFNFAQTYYVSPTGSGLKTGNSEADAAAFSVPTLQTDWLGATQKTDVTIVFLAGAANESYLLGPDPSSPYVSRLRIFGSEPVNGAPSRTVRLIGFPDATTGRLPKIKLTIPVLSSTSAGYYRTQWPPAGVILDSMISMTVPAPGSTEFTFEGRAYLKRFEIQNLELDGGFTEMGALTSAGNDVGYKSYAVDLWADSGLIRNVVVRNFGSVGDVPHSIVEGGNAGVEGFPVNFSTRFKSTPPSTDLDRWIVEETIVTDFRSVHGGYGTMIMPHVFIPGAAYNGSLTAYLGDGQSGLSPQVIVRRCAIQGAHGAAVGTAGRTFAESGNGYASGRILFTDNVILNSNLAMNTDTGWVGTLSLNRNAILDIANLANMGTAGVPSANATMRYYDLSDNLLRIRGRDAVPVYRDYSITSLSNYGSDPNLVLGRYMTGLASGLVIQGGMKDLRFLNNQFTTWPQDQFFRPEPSISDPTGLLYKWFRPIFVVPTDTFVNEQYMDRTRDYALQAEIGQSRFSSSPFDFAEPASILQGGNPATLSPTVLPDYTSAKAALTSPGTAFQPRGTVQRVMMVPPYVPLPKASLLNNPPASLQSTAITGVREIAIGEPQWAGNTLNVSVRVAEHRLPVRAGNGVVTPGATVPVSSATVRLQVNVSRYSHSNPISLNVINSPPTGTDGRATIPVDLNALLTSNPNMYIRLEAWVDSTGSPTAAFQKDIVAWSTHELSAGAAVSLRASPDVGDDKNTTSAKRAKLLFKRTGATATALPVNITLPTSFTTPHGEQLIATYGTSGNADYYFQATGAASLTFSSGIPTAVIIPAGASEAVVDIVTRADNVTEQDLVRVQLAGPTQVAPSSNWYAVATPNPVDVLIYDGPEWTIQELTDSSVFTVSSKAGGVNEGTFNSSGAWSIFPQVAGSMVTTPLGGGASSPSAAWWSPSATLPYSLGAGSFLPTGISQRSSATAQSVIVGNSGNSAARILDNGSGYTVLKHLEATEPISAVFGVNLDASRFVGRSRKLGVDRPVFWSGAIWTNPPTDLAAGIVASRIGVANAVNNSGTVIGEFQMSAQSGTGPTPPTIIIKRGFRMASVAQALSEANDVLKAPGEVLGSPLETSAIGLSSNSEVVGAFNIIGSVKTASYWPTGQSTASSLGRWKPVYGNNLDIESEARGINASGWIVGWSRPATGNSRAVFRRSSVLDGSPPPWIDLNDSHAVYGIGGWTLLQADSITDSGVIIGQGIKSGYSRGFILVRRSSEN